MSLDDLGTPLRPMTRVLGKVSNRLYRLDTDQGSFAVKELSLVDRRSTYNAADVFRFEQAAFAAGIPMPEPISADPDVLVHRWVEGDRLPEVPVSATFAFEVGEILAHIHALSFELNHMSVDDPTPRDWPELAERAAATGQPWADELASLVETFLAIAHFVDSCERPGPVVVTHKDIRPWNILARDGRPVVLDWELSGKLELTSELGSTALSIAKGHGFEDIEPTVFRSVLDGYVSRGGVLPPPGPSWFVYTIEGWLGFTRWNILRCLALVEPATGSDLATAHEEILNGLRGLPDMFGRLPELEDLLV
jgi:aminoglycoside phosphotransferase (APT) family kinase protein